VAFSLSSVDPETVAEDGGRLIEITGSFELQNRYKVHVGPNSSSADPACHSGKPGQGTIVYPLSAGLLRCYTPVVVPGGTYTITVVNQDTAEEHQLATALTVVPRHFWTGVYSLRRMFPAWLRTGPRKIDLETR
jgi:hypothetical protein